MKIPSSFLPCKIGVLLDADTFSAFSELGEFQFFARFQARRGLLPHWATVSFHDAIFSGNDSGFSDSFRLI